jgi:hypothetical protein
MNVIMGLKSFLGLCPPGRRVNVFPDDVFLTSYPKCGNTWLRFLIANLIYPEKNPDLTNINILLPDIEGGRKRDFGRIQRPRILKSHQYFDHRYSKIIYLVRDPRDVVLAEHHFDIKRRVIPPDLPLEEFVSRFVSGQLSHPNGTWAEHVATWLSTRFDDPRFLLVKYESIQTQPMVEMERLAAFLGVVADQEQLAFAIKQSTAERVRELEKKQWNVFGSTRETRPDMPYIRSGKSGGWKTQLPQPSVAVIESAWGGLMNELGYELTVPELANLPQKKRPSTTVWAQRWNDGVGW